MATSEESLTVMAGQALHAARQVTSLGRAINTGHAPTEADQYDPAAQAAYAFAVVQVLEHVVLRLAREVDRLRGVGA